MEKIKVFISWSGEKSGYIADLLSERLQCVIQSIEPWTSRKDLDRGTLWYNEIADKLSKTEIGIVCLTQENKNKPWILFESGAIAKGLNSNKVCTLLIDLEYTEIENPLAQFNHTKLNREGILQLVRTINDALKENALNDKTLEKIFDRWWPEFDEKSKEIIEASPSKSSEAPTTRSDEDILSEILLSVRSLDKRLRIIESNTENRTENNTDIAHRSNRPCYSFLSFSRQMNEYDSLVSDLLEQKIPPFKIEQLLLERYDIPPSECRRIIRKALKRETND